MTLVYRAEEDCEIGGYFIPKGTHLLLNIHAIHHDTKVWGHDHEEFKPSRFLSPDGKKFIKNDCVVAFGYGNYKYSLINQSTN